MKFKRHSGFTLIEMMIAMVVLAVLITVGAPAFTKMIKDNRLLGEAYGLRAALDGARSEAIAQRVLCDVLSQQRWSELRRQLE